MAFDPFLSQKVHLPMVKVRRMKEGCLKHIIGCSAVWNVVTTALQSIRHFDSRLIGLLGNEVRSCYKSVIGLMWKGSMPSLTCAVSWLVPAAYWSQCLPPSNQGVHADHTHQGASRQKLFLVKEHPTSLFSAIGRKSRLFFKVIWTSWFKALRAVVMCISCIWPACIRPSCLRQNQGPS